MTVAEIQDRVAKIRHIAIDVDDNEVAHSAEDDLWRDVLQAIAAGAPNAAELAIAAIATLAIDYTRWHA